MTVKSVKSLMEKRNVELEVITEGFDKVFMGNQASSDSVYLVQCEVRHMKKSMELKRITKPIRVPLLTGDAPKKSPIPTMIGFKGMFLFKNLQLNVSWTMLSGMTTTTSFTILWYI
jgi:hypothetical protein